MIVAVIDPFPLPSPPPPPSHHPNTQTRSHFLPLSLGGKLPPTFPHCFPTLPPPLHLSLFLPSHSTFLHLHTGCSNLRTLPFTTLPLTLPSLPLLSDSLSLAAAFPPFPPFPPALHLPGRGRASLGQRCNTRRGLLGAGRGKETLIFRRCSTDGKGNPRPLLS
ncbi:hypothetical protein E2C01_037367 [Portunus trituberculatus]|uniref:Uncharacterized protein n=1 Tax=Portunus trituberculatus TaxID=210409 RepID=A0A5B7FDY9_PORTR|nr:hypothetical protein [Portunus trituberculatus]